jgi:hypothetical protein
MITNFYLNGVGFQAQDPGYSDQDSQYAPTPGYYEPSECGFSPSPNYCPQNGPELLVSTLPEALKLLQLSDWEANRPDDKLPACFIRYSESRKQVPRWTHTLCSSAHVRNRLSLYLA